MSYFYIIKAPMRRLHARAPFLPHLYTGLLHHEQLAMREDRQIVSPTDTSPSLIGAFNYPMNERTNLPVSRDQKTDIWSAVAPSLLSVFENAPT